MKNKYFFQRHTPFAIFQQSLHYPVCWALFLTYGFFLSCCKYLKNDRGQEHQSKVSWPTTHTLDDLGHMD